jgi:hypothetical protein
MTTPVNPPPHPADPAEDAPESSQSLYEAYADYSRTLRTWLVAYGVGGPVLLLSNEHVTKAIATSGAAGLITKLFLGGVAAQVTLAALNKAAMWGCYYGALWRSFQDRRRYKACVWFSEQFWIDFTIDVVTMALFGGATLLTLRVVVNLS